MYLKTGKVVAGHEAYLQTCKQARRDAYSLQVRRDFTGQDGHHQINQEEHAQIREGHVRSGGIHSDQ
jgi:hypothetical protein